MRILDIADEADFRRIPACADPRFDHRTCDHWEDADRGSRSARATWLEVPAAAAPPPPRRPSSDNPFAPPPRDDTWNPFAGGGRGGVATAVPLDPFADGADDGGEGVPPDNPFAPTDRVERGRTVGVPRKLALLDRGRGVFGSYAKVMLDGERATAFAQFGPLSAYPRASRIRELYPQLPGAPLPAVITCIATTAEARHLGHARRLVEAIAVDLGARGFAAIETYPDRTQSPDATSSASPGFWEACGFTLVIDDARYPVMRRELD